MKTIQIKKIATISSIIVLMLVSSPVFSQDPGLPGDAGVVTEDQVAENAPIDQNIWLGLVGGCLIGAFFFAGKQKNALTK